MLPDLLSDPFGEKGTMRFARRLALLGGHFHFDSNDRRLMQLVDIAYRGLPTQLFSLEPPQLHVRLLSNAPVALRKRGEPAPFHMFSAGSLLGGTTAESNFVVMSSQSQAAAVTISQGMLDFPYHARYELIEFTVFTLAARSQGLISLHAACVGHAGRGILLMGESGAGKSTLSLHALLRGFDFLAEDSVFVSPHTMLATGVANFLHMTSNALRWLKGTPSYVKIRASPVIRRRSGAVKFEYDLRGGRHALASAPLKIVGVVFLSAESSQGGPLLRKLAPLDAAKRLRTQQAYAANQTSWKAFEKSASRISAYELRRGRHPNEGVDALAELLDKA
jgi:hypothetical protein